MAPKDAALEISEAVTVTPCAIGNVQLFCTIKHDGRLTSRAILTETRNPLAVLLGKRKNLQFEDFLGEPE